MASAGGPATLPDSYSFAEFTALAIPHMERLIAGFRTPCQLILSLGTGSGKSSSGIAPLLVRDRPTIIVAIDGNFKHDVNRNSFKGLLSAYGQITIYFIHEQIPTNYPDQTFKLRLRTFDVPRHGKKILFGFADKCVPRDDYPLNPLVPMLQRVLDIGGRIIVQNEIYFHSTSYAEHNDSYYSLNSFYKGEYPNIYNSAGRHLPWRLGSTIENEHMQDLCEIPYIMRQLRPIERVLYLDRGYLRPFIIESERNVTYNNNSGYQSRQRSLDLPLLKPGPGVHFTQAVPIGIRGNADLIVMRIVTERNLDLLRSFIRHTGINRKFRGGWTYLHYAVLWNFIKGVTFLIDAGIDVNAVSEDGRTALDCTYNNASYF